MLAMKIKQPTQPAQACVIWMHGLGSNAANMLALAEELVVRIPIRHVCLEAPIRAVTLYHHTRVQAWYDIHGLETGTREDSAGVLESQQAIEQVIASQRDDGMAQNRIFLAGFSQGAGMALFTGLHSQHALGGLICLSGYLPLAAQVEAKLGRHTPIFLGLGVNDTVVIPSWTQHSQQWLQAQGYTQVVLKHYPMEHSVCRDELYDISTWLNQQLGGVHD